MIGKAIDDLTKERSEVDSDRLNISDWIELIGFAAIANQVEVEIEIGIEIEIEIELTTQHFGE
jgi:hypothetical protein